MGSLGVDPGPRSCPHCGRSIEPNLVLGPTGDRASPVRKPSTARYLPHLSSAVGRLREDTRYLAGIVGWPAAVWKVTRTAALNALVVISCLVVVALPQAHLAARAVAGAILAIQVGCLLFRLRQIRREAAQSRLAQLLAPAAQHRAPPKTGRPRPPTARPPTLTPRPTPVRAQPGQPDPLAEIGLAE